MKKNLEKYKNKDGHSFFSPSSIALFSTCPGYEREEVEKTEGEDMEEEEDAFSPSAIGTRIHEALEKWTPVISSPNRSTGSTKFARASLKHSMQR